MNLQKKYGYLLIKGLFFKKKNFMFPIWISQVFFKEGTFNKIFSQ